MSISLEQEFTKTRPYLYGCTQKELHTELDHWNYYSPDEPAFVEASSIKWQYVAEFPITKIESVGDPSLIGWVEWLATESRMSVDDCGYDRYTSLEEWWKVNPYQEPVVLVQGKDENFYIWDGWHRTGISHKLGWQVLPAWVGYMK